MKHQAPAHTGHVKPVETSTYQMPEAYVHPVHNKLLSLRRHRPGKAFRYLFQIIEEQQRFGQ